MFKLTPDRKRLIENFFSLSFVQAAGYLLPLITVPYLVRILGPEKFGLLAFVQAFVQYFILLTDYGFNLSATRKISIFRDDRDRVSQIFSSVMVIKLFFLLASLIIMALFVFAIPKFKAYALLYFLTFGLVIGNTLFPVWLFQGTERMKYITFLNIIPRVIFTIMIFIFIRRQEDYYYVPAINSLGAIVSGILSLWIVWKSFNVVFKIPSLKMIMEELKDGWQLFISTMAISLYTTSNTFILGILTDNTAVGYYSAAEKLINVVIGGLMPVWQSVYPYISKLAGESKEAAYNFLKKAVTALGISAFLISSLIFIFARPIINIALGTQYQESIAVLRILSFVPFVIALAIVYARFYLLGFGYYKELTRIVMGSAVLSLAFAFTFVHLLSLAERGAAIAWLLTEVCVLTFSFITYRRLRSCR